MENNMEKGIVKLSLENAKELYEQGGNFRTIALSAYSEDELVFTPKDGNFVYAQLKNRNCYIFIKDKYIELTSKHISLNLYSKELSTDCRKCCSDSDILFIRYATQEEKDILLKKMHEDGKDWDPINKKVISYRWRAKLNKKYYYVQTPSVSSAFVASSVEDYGIVDNARHENHNYFKTKEETQEVADKINNIFKDL